MQLGFVYPTNLQDYDCPGNKKKNIPFSRALLPVTAGVLISYHFGPLGFLDYDAVSFLLLQLRCATVGVCGFVIPSLSSAVLTYFS